MAVGSLTLVMLLTSPVCHLHYFCLALPLVMGIVAAAWDRNGSMRLGVGPTLLFAVFFIGSLLPSLPGLAVLRDLGLAGYAGLLLWLGGCVAIWKRGRIQPITPVHQDQLVTAAA